MASAAVMVPFRSMNSAVMMLPTDCSGYLRNWLMSLRVSGRAFFSTRISTPAGSSSSRSTVSSIASSSRMPASSRSGRETTIICWVSGGRLEKTSAACSLGSVRKASAPCSWGRPSRRSARSTGFCSARMAESSR